MERKGFFITFEGGEGCGKSTQISLLESALKSAGEEVLVLREPGGTCVGEAIRHLLKSPEEGSSLVPEAELLLFAASRAQLVREKIRPALARGQWVLCDRFLDSTTVYQGVARCLDSSQVSLINRFAVGDTLPDRTFFLDLPWGEARLRVGKRNEAPDRFDSENDLFHNAVREGFLRLAEREPERVATLDASASQQSLATVIQKNISSFCHVLFS